LIRKNSPRFATHLGIPTQPTSCAQIEVLLIARATVDHMLPVLTVINILVSGRSSCEILQNFGSGATMSFWVGKLGLHCLLVTTLQAYPLLFGGLALHVRQLLWHTPPPWMREVLPISFRNIPLDPSPELLLQRLPVRGV